MSEKLYDPRLLFSGNRRRAWLKGAINDDFNTGRISGESTNLLLNKAAEANTDRHLRDLLWCDVAVHYPGIVATMAGFAHGYNISSPEWMIGSVAFHLIPKIGPGSVARTLYLGGRAFQERFIVKEKQPVLSGTKELLNLGLSLMPLIGHASVLVRMSKECPEVSGFLLHHSATRDLRVPILNRVMSKVDSFTQRCYNKLTDSKLDLTQVPK